MYLAITTTSSSTLKAVKRHYFIALAAACLAFTAIGASAVLSGVDFGGSASPPAPFRSSFSDTPEMALPRMTYYIVGSEEQRVAVLAQAAQIDEDLSISNPDRDWQFAVLMAGTMEAEKDALATLDEVKARWSAAGVAGLEIADVREPELRLSLANQRLPVVIYLVESQARADYLLRVVESDRNESYTRLPLFFAFKATTPEEEANVAAFVKSWEGREVQVIDYRNLAPID